MALEDNVLTAEQQAYIDWLTTPPSLRDPPSKEKYAVHIGRNVETLRRWEKKDVFRRAWNTQADDVVGSPEKAQMLLEEMLSRGMAGDVGAAKLYFQVTGKMKPAEVNVNTTSSSAELSDSELEALIAQGLQQERQARTAT